MLHLSTLAFGSVMLGKEQNGGAVLSAVCHPGDTGSNVSSSDQASAQELWLNFFQYPCWLDLKSARVSVHYHVDALQQGFSYRSGPSMA